MALRLSVFVSDAGSLVLWLDYYLQDKIYGCQEPLTQRVDVLVCRIRRTDCGNEGSTA